MDLERLSVRLRPRAPWEAVDLGFAMVRTWGRSVYGPWLALTLPISLLLIWTLHFWGVLIFWWLLPLFEVMVLYPLSRAVFGEVPTSSQTLRAAPAEMRRAWHEVVTRRLHPARSFALPIGQLEGLSGSERRQRRAVLSRSIDVHGSVTVVFVCLHWLLICSLLVLVMWMTPSWFGVDWETFWDVLTDGEGAVWHYDLVGTAWALVLIAIDPFYVAAGFALYLDRRTVLEGWDLDIAFRRLARRLRKLERDRSSSRGSQRAAAWWLGLVVGGLLVGFGSWPAGKVGAQEIEPVPTQIESAEPAVWNGAESEDPRRIARDITSRPEFGGKATETRWRLRKDLTQWLEDDSPKERSSRPSPILLGLVWLLAWLSELSLWVVLIGALVAVVVVALRKWPQGRGRSPSADDKAPETLFGLDLRAESLPDDIAAEAESLWRRGELAAALSLLYRGALARLSHEGVTLAESFTEDDCLRAARRVLPPVRTGFLAELTGVWQRAAYGHRMPDTGDGERWWAGWRRHFGPES